jgi:[ribosomal protein S5]-alanine N-acetyltransferase
MATEKTNMPAPQPTIGTERLSLRAYQISDAPRVQQLAGDIRIAEMTSNIPHPYPDGAAESWILAQADAYALGKAVAFAVTERGSDQTIGTVSLFNLHDHQAEIGYWIGVEWQGQGYCSEAVEALIGFGISELGINHFHARHLQRNPISGKVLRNNGLRKIGAETMLWRDGLTQEVLEVYQLLIEEAAPES